jgi:hypothetical protein
MKIKMKDKHSKSRARGESEPKRSALDDFLIVDKPCSVTLFDMHVQVHRDGRERGLWIRLNDTSEARAVSYKRWLEGAIETFCTLVGISEQDIRNKFSAELHMRHEIGQLLNSKVEEAALLEWPELKQVYDAIGRELKKYEQRQK